MIALIQKLSDSIVSAGNDNIITVSGNTYGLPNVVGYKFIADLFISGSPVVTLKVSPDPVFGFGVFNTRGIVSSFSGSDFFSTDPLPFQIIRNCPSSNCQIDIQLGEEYTSGNTFIQNRDLISGNTRIYINASLPFISESQSLKNYLPFSGNANVLYLSDKPRQNVNSSSLGTKSSLLFTAWINERKWLYYVRNLVGNASPGNGTTAIFIFTYSDSAFQNNIGLYQLTDQPAIVLSTDVQCFAVGYPQLALLTSGQTSISSGTFPVIKPSVNSYMVLVSAGVNSAFFEPAYFVVNSDCGRFASTAYTISWLNTLGGYNSWLFNKKNETTQNKQTQMIKRGSGVLGSNGSYSFGTQQQKAFFTVLQDSIVMNTDFLSDADVLYLKGLFSSPSIFMTDQTGLVTSITIQEDSYRINKRVNQKIYSLEMTVNESYNDYRQ